MILIVAAYVVRGVFIRRRGARGEDSRRWRSVSFAAGILALAAAESWPLHDLAEGFLFSAHMLQHLLFMLVVPPLILMGISRSAINRALASGVLSDLIRFLTRPVVATILFNVTVVAIHWPPVVQLQVDSDLAHLGVHVVILVASGLMWWPIVEPDGRKLLSEPAKMLYLFVQSVLPTIPASFLTFASEPIYGAYTGDPRVWGLSPVTDLTVSGLMMKLGGGIILWLVIAIIFFRWQAKDE